MSLKPARWIVLSALVLIAIGAYFFFDPIRKLPFFFTPKGEIASFDKTQTQAEKTKRYQYAKEIVNPASFINIDSVKIQDLIGKKVILVDFWTYSCINCQRTLPYLNAWYEKYQSAGLEIIGVHTPEFGFEKIYDNVKRATEKYGVKYPVVLDNDYGTWRAYRNLYWPRKYLIDIDGFIVYDHIGEGAYAETEKKIQELLLEKAQVLNEEMSLNRDTVKPENAETIDFNQPLSPETYFGAQRNEYLNNGQKNRLGLQTFRAPINPKTNSLYFDGDWLISDEYAQNQSAEAKIIFRYQAQKVFIVARADQAVSVKILVDGQPINELAGADVKDGVVVIQADQLYRLVEDQTWAEHTLEIIPQNPGLQVFAFTFG